MVSNCNRTEPSFQRLRESMRRRATPHYCWITVFHLCCKTMAKVTLLERYLTRTITGHALVPRQQPIYKALHRCRPLSTASLTSSSRRIQNRPCFHPGPDSFNTTHVRYLRKEPIPHAARYPAGAQWKTPTHATDRCIRGHPTFSNNRLALGQRDRTLCSQN
jgi:hypothetical protein